MTEYQPSLRELISCAGEKKDEVARWLFFRVGIGLVSLWVGLILSPIFWFFRMEISPFDVVRNGNIIVFVTVLTASSIGLFWETKRGFAWRLAFWNCMALGGVFFVATLHLAVLLVPQAKSSSKEFVVVLSFCLLVLAVVLAMGAYLTTLLDRKVLEGESVQDEEERKVIALQKKAEHLESVGPINLTDEPQS